MEFDPADFRPAFSAEVAPESPARGWRCPTWTFDADGAAVPGLDAVGATTLVGFAAPSAEWVGQFLAGAGGATGVLATPDPRRACVLADGRAHLVAVDTEPPQAHVLADGVQSALASASPPLLVLTDGTGAMAIGPEGLRWRTGRLAIDDLTLVAITPDGVLVECDSPGVGGVRTIVLDVATGDQIDGPPLPDALR